MRKAGFRQRRAPAPQAELVLWLPVAILPGAVVLVGILAVVGRRRRSR